MRNSIYPAIRLWMSDSTFACFSLCFFFFRLLAQMLVVYIISFFSLFVLKNLNIEIAESIVFCIRYGK